MIVDIFSLSIYSNGFGSEFNYQVVKDYCKRENLEALKIWKILKKIKEALK